MQRDEEHKAVKSKDVKDEEVVRIPIAFAMVTLMQTLPPHVMEANLPGYVCNSPPRWMGLKPKKKKNLQKNTYVLFPCSILIKVCVLLRNRFQEIRDVARGTLVKITQTLGIRYLQYLLKEMRSILVKGYQVGAETEHPNMLFPKK